MHIRSSRPRSCWTTNGYDDKIHTLCPKRPIPYRVAEVCEDRDICDKLELCYTVGCDSVVTGSIWIANTAGSACSAIGSAIYTYFTFNDYANLNQVLIGTAVGLYVNAASTPIGDAILNSLHKLVNKTSTTDACGVTQREVLASDFGNAIF